MAGCTSGSRDARQLRSASSNGGSDADDLAGARHTHVRARARVRRRRPRRALPTEGQRSDRAAPARLARQLGLAPAVRGACAALRRDRPGPARLWRFAAPRVGAPPARPGDHRVAVARSIGHRPRDPVGYRPGRLGRGGDGDHAAVRDRPTRAARAGRSEAAPWRDRRSDVARSVAVRARWIS